jgi:hypothetical protein
MTSAKKEANKRGQGKGKEGEKKQQQSWAEEAGLAGPPRQS